MICSEWVIVRVRPRVLPTLDGLSAIILILQVNLNLSMIFEKSTYAYAWLWFWENGGKLNSASQKLSGRNAFILLLSLFRIHALG